MTGEENKAIVVRHLKEVLEGGRVELIDSYYAPDGSAAEMETAEQWRDRVLWFHNACPGFKITILDLMAEGDKVMSHTQVDLTYTVPPESPPSRFFPPLGRPVSWRNMNTFRIVNGKMVSFQGVWGWSDMLVKIGVIPLEQVENNKAAVQKFTEALNCQDGALLSEVCTPEVAQKWTEALPEMIARMKDHHIELVDWAVDGECVAVKMATSGYHTGEMYGIPATGKWWTNRVFTFFRFTDGKISEVDPQPDAENLIKQIGGSNPIRGSLMLPGVNHDEREREKEIEFWPVL
jgi:predicted ester cyclase